MTGMEHAIDRAAEVIRAAIDRQADIVADGLHLDVQGVITPHWIAEALATNGLLSPAPLREEWGVQTQGGNILKESSEERARSEVRLYGDRLVHKFVSDWLPADAVNSTEGDGRVDR